MRRLIRAKIDVDQLGNAPDRILAARLGVAPSTILRTRQRYEVQAYALHQSTTDKYLALLQAHPRTTREVAQVLHISRQGAWDTLCRLEHKGLVHRRSQIRGRRGQEPLEWSLLGRIEWNTTSNEPHASIQDHHRRYPLCP